MSATDQREHAPRPPSAAPAMPSRPPQALGQLADLVSGKLSDPSAADRLITGCASLEDATADDISFLSHDRYEHHLASTQAAAVLIKTDQALPPGRIAIACKDPYYAFTKCVIELYGYRQHPGSGISPKAYVHADARIGAGCTIMPGATVSAGATVGDRCVLYPGVFVGPDVILGDACVLHPNVVVYDACVLGHRVTIHANTTIGQDGLGYAPVGGSWVKIPQVGRVRIGDDVELGANCAIDRATVGETVIARGTKMSDGVVIGHGCKIGEDCMFVAQVGLAGSVKVGRHVVIAGQAGTVGHITIGDHATIAARAGVVNDVPEKATYAGEPAGPIAEKKREVTALMRLPDLMKQFRQLRKTVERLCASTGVPMDDDRS